MLATCLHCESTRKIVLGLSHQLASVRRAFASSILPNSEALITSPTDCCNLGDGVCHAYAGQDSSPALLCMDLWKLVPPTVGCVE